MASPMPWAPPVTIATLSFSFPWSFIVCSCGSAARNSLARDGAMQELAAVAQPFLVDAVADAGGDMPFGRHVERGERAGRLEQGLHRDQVVGLTMHQQHRRARRDLGRQLI